MLQHKTALQVIGLLIQYNSWIAKWQVPTPSPVTGRLAPPLPPPSRPLHATMEWEKGETAFGGGEKFRCNGELCIRCIYYINEGGVCVSVSVSVKIA